MFRDIIPHHLSHIHQSSIGGIEKHVGSYVIL